jgi:hypothetical protein
MMKRVHFAETLVQNFKFDDCEVVGHASVDVVDATRSFENIFPVFLLL